MPAYSMASNMAQNSCLQQQATSSYSCMLPPGSVRGYDPLSLGSYSRGTSCPTAPQPTHPSIQSLNGQFNSVNSGSSSTGLISPGVSVPVQVSGHSSDLSNVTNQHYWPRVQCN